MDQQGRLQEHSLAASSSQKIPQDLSPDVLSLSPCPPPRSDSVAAANTTSDSGLGHVILPPEPREFQLVEVSYFDDPWS